jgi:hypothetical protein
LAAFSKTSSTYVCNSLLFYIFKQDQLLRNHQQILQQMRLKKLPQIIVKLQPKKVIRVKLRLKEMIRVKLQLKDKKISLDLKKQPHNKKLHLKSQVMEIVAVLRLKKVKPILYVQLASGDILKTVTCSTNAQSPPKLHTIAL